MFSNFFDISIADMNPFFKVLSTRRFVCLMLVTPWRWSATRYHTHVWTQMGGGQKIVPGAERISVYTASTVGGDLNKSNPKCLSLYVVFYTQTSSFTPQAEIFLFCTLSLNSAKSIFCLFISFSVWIKVFIKNFNYSVFISDFLWRRLVSIWQLLILLGHISSFSVFSRRSSASRDRMYP